MEFFKIVNRKTTESEIQDLISPEKVGKFADSMIYINSSEENFIAFTLWGEFRISYDKIKGGVRLTLLDCPNALSWTITTGYPPSCEKVVIHCTINRKEKNSQFVEEVELLLEEWSEGIKIHFK